MGFLPSFTTIQWLTYAAVALVLLGCGLACAFGVMRGILWLLTLSGRVMSRLWAYIWRQPFASHGTAHFADDTDVERAGFYAHPEHLPLAQFEGKTLFEPVGGSVALVAPPRSHKSFGVIMPALRAFRGSIICHDPRGELFEHTHAEREQYGPVLKFDPANKMSAAIDPLALIRWNTDQQHGDLQRVSLALLSPDAGQPWSEYALEAVPLLTAMLIERHEAGVQGLGAVVRALVDPTTTLKAKFEALLKHPHPTVAQAARRMADKSEARQAAVVQHVLSCLNVFTDPLVDANTSANDLDLLECQYGAQPVTVYWCAEFSEARRLRGLFGCLLEQLLARFGSPGEKRHKVLFALDECMALGYSEQLESGMSHFAGDGLVCLLAFQNRRQALRTYGEFSPLLDSIPTTMYFCPVHTDLITREEISEILGVTTGEYATRSQRVSAWGLLQSETRGSQRLERRLMTSDEVAQMDEEACIVVTKAHPPVMARKLDAAPVPVLTLPQRYKRPAIAASVAAALMLSVWSITHVWPRPETPAPRLAMTRETGPSPGAGGMPAEAGSMTARSDDQAPEPSPGLTFAERWAYVQPPEKPWAIWRDIRGAGYANAPQPEPRLSRWETKAECEVARAEYVEQIYQQIATQPPGQVMMRKLWDGRLQQSWGGLMGQPPPIITFLCLKADGQSS